MKYRFESKKGRVCLSKVKIIGHRGCMGSLPENSLSGFRKAIEVGADGIELDIHRTKDGEIVVIHDETINRTSNGNGLVKEMTLKQLKTYNLNAIDGSVSDEKIPTLKEVFHLLKDHPDVIINIELKMHRVLYPDLEEQLVRLVSEYKLENEIIYSSFHLPTLVRLKQFDCEAKIAYLIKRSVPKLHDYVEQFQFDGIHPSKKLYESDMAFFKKCGNIRLWTINQDRAIRESLTWEIDSIITDFPEKAIAIRDKKGKRKFRFPNVST